MFVVVVVVFRVAVAVMQVIHVIPVLDCLMGAVRAAVLVVGGRVFRGIIVFVVVAVVFCMAVAIVQIVHMVTVLDSDMRTVGAAVLMF